MEVLEGSFASWQAQDTPGAVTLGVFDGVHLGHRSLFADAFDTNARPTVVTFDPHPVEVLAPGTPPRLITTIEERLELFAAQGVELVAVLDLAEVRYFSPQQFVDEILAGKLSTARLTIGSDFHFGKDRAGDVAFLARAGRAGGFDVQVADLVADGGQVVSSSRIRSLIEAGSVADAAALLATRYTVTNEVIDGDKRGRDIGFPTANIRPVPRKVTPADGVYATIVEVAGKRWMAATNVGTRPTFGGGDRLIEAYILDFDEEIYGDRLTIEFVDRLRPELEFPSVEKLVEQMEDDVAVAREILSPVVG